MNNAQVDMIDNSSFEKPERPQFLNVLTILTFVGCGLGIIFSLATPMLMKMSKEMMSKAPTADASTADIEKMRAGLEGIALVEKNMVPIMVTGVIGIILCFLGALMMRKLKKDGYWLYVAGQLIPFIAGFILMGTAQYNSVGSFLVPVIVLAFIVMYTSQKKYLVY